MRQSGRVSQSFEVNGLWQGSVLSPRLFNISIDGLIGSFLRQLVKSVWSKNG